MMRYDRVDAGLFVRNRERLRELLKPGALAIVHANDLMPTNADGVMPFVQNRDLYHLTGLDQEETVLVMFPGAPEAKDREILFVRETSEHIATWEGRKLDKEEAAGVSGIPRVEWAATFESHWRRLMPQARRVYLATNEHLRAESMVETRNMRFIRRCQRHYPLHRYERLAPLMHAVRAVKDEAEIGQMQTAVDITGAGFRRALDFIEPGVGEWEIEAEYLHEFVRRRSRGFAYPPIVGTGANACVLHYLDNSAVCQDGQMLLMDVGAEWANWNADMTRTVPVNGRFTPRQREVYEAVRRVKDAATGILRPGITPAEWRDRAVAMMEEELIRLGLVDAAEARRRDPERKPLVQKYYMHGIGHHLGLDVHDVSPPDEPVRAGMVFTVEPGIYIREENLGVRLEDDILVGEHGNHNLLANIPIDPDEIEELMNR